MNDRTRLRETAGLTVGLVLAAVLVLVVVDPGRFRSVLDFGPASAPAADADDGSVAKPVTGLRDTPPPPGGPAFAVDPANPFAGSPAAGYPAGIAGLRMPAAKRVGAFPAKEVAQALDLARRYFAASRLDPKVIAGQYPAGVVALLDPKSKDTALSDALRRPTKENDPVQFVTRSDPRQDVLHGSVIKVNGTATLRLAARDELVVAVDALVVYAFRRVDGPTEVTRVILRVQQELRAFHGLDTTPGTLVRGKSATSWAGMVCSDTTDGYVHPQYPSEWDDSLRTGEDPYDARRSPAGDGGCRTAARI